ncbi:MAG TPA: (2Fe-2S)-binding protein [Dehalococcoidia bacterium]|nr:(2Fe-2S)-binding protein [Dehalococcoidia bacterium]
MKKPLSATVNGDVYERLVDPRTTLLEWLRDDLGLTGTKEGCSNGNCGACTVMIDGQTACSCLVFALEIDGKAITTVEGIGHPEALDPVQSAFIEHAAMQCGFCTPGFIVSARAFLNEHPSPTEEEIRLGIAGNLCRCTGYDKIVRAVQAAAARQ